jgi:hypothetical protein
MVFSGYEIDSSTSSFSSPAKPVLLFNRTGVAIPAI